ncbi:MAG: EAL domain-containing protein [Caulobacteraceae bacterium]|nr:EAL domain-containing protein [Caulobacter sp.]
MRKAILALLAGAYLCIALAAGALFWRGGAGWGAGAGVFAGVLAFLFALHNLMGRGFDMGAIRKELSQLRDAHRILADHLEETEGALEELAVRLQATTAGRTTSLTDEVRMLEGLVQRMGEDLEARLKRELPPEAAGGRQQTALLETIREALAENRVDLFLQPVVGLPQRRTAYYESFTRLRDATGRVMMPAEYLAVAEPEGLVGAIDNLLLFRCVQIVRRLAKTDRRVGIFCNISPASLADDRFFPQFLDYLRDNRDLSAALIFELGQEAFAARTATQARNMGKLAELGFRFSLDKVSRLDIDVADCARADVRFVKVAADALLREIADHDGRLTLKSRPDLQAADFAGWLRRAGVELVAEKVENERQAIDVLELDVRLGQGHLFGQPRPVRDQVLAETSPPAAFVAERLEGWSQARRAAG